MQSRIGGGGCIVFLVFISLLEKAYDVADGFQRAAQVEEFLLVHVHTFHPDTFQRGADIEEILCGKIFLFLGNPYKLHHLFQSAVDFLVVVRESHFVYTFFSQSA